MAIVGSDPLSLLARLSGAVGAPVAEGAAAGSSSLDATQRAVTVGEVVPIVFCRRVGDVGGVLVSPGATEARFQNSSSNAVTAYYHLVISEGQIDRLQVRDVFQQSCRVGSHSQSYNRRAGSWTPGNFIVARAGYTVPECPYYCGSGGSYAGLSTLSFRCTYPDGDGTWDRQVHAFVRGGMYVTRLLDSVAGPSNNYADLVHWALQNCSRVPAALIDTAALTDAARFLDTTGLLCNIRIDSSTNLEELIADTAPLFLLAQSKRQGQKGLRPLLPTIPETGAIDTRPISPRWLFDSRPIIPDTFEITYTPLADRRPFCAQMLWRQQPTDDFGLIRTTEVRYTGFAEDGPFEQYDLSAFCCSENHAVKVGSYLIARRRHVEHTLRVSVLPGPWSALIEAGDIVRVRLRREATASPASIHDFLYEVNRIGRSIAGDLQLELTHFPVDAEGRSVVAREVAAATGGGVLLPTGRTGVSCDLNDPTDNSELPDEGVPGVEPDLPEWGVDYPPLTPLPPGGADDPEDDDRPRIDFGTPVIVDGIVQIPVIWENIPEDLQPLDPGQELEITMDNGDVVTFTGDDFDMGLPDPSTQTTLWVDPTGLDSSGGGDPIGIASVRLIGFGSSYSARDYDTSAKVPDDKIDEEKEDEDERMRITFGTPSVVEGLVRVQVNWENIPTGLQLLAPGLLTPPRRLLIFMDNGFVPIFTSDAFDHEPGQADVQSLVWQFPAVGDGELSTSINGVELQEFESKYSAANFDLSATLKYANNSETSLRKVSTGTADAFDMVDTYTLATPVGTASWSTPSIPSTYGGAGVLTSQGTLYVGWDPVSGVISYIAGIRVSQSYGSGAGRSRFYGHLIELGGSVAVFRSAVDDDYRANFPPDGQEFIGGVGLDAWTFSLGGSANDAPGYVTSISST
jgi:hypothetical protein